MLRSPHMGTMLALASLLLLQLLVCSRSAAAELHPHDEYMPNVAAMRIKIDEALSLSVTPNVLSGPASYVEVRWTGNTRGAANDWIAAYSPIPESHDGFMQVMPVKYMNLTTSPGVSGSISIWLLHMRAPWVFAYMTGGYENPTLLSVSNPVTYVPEQANVPMQIHLARTVDPSQMRVVWVTTNATQPVVKFTQTAHARTRGRGRAARGLTGSVVVKATTNTYTRDQMCGGMAAGLGWRDPGSIHTAVLEGLLPGQQYSYMVGDAASGVFSPASSFYAAPAPASDTDVLIFGDQGQAEFDGSIGWAEWVTVDGVLTEDADQPAAINTSISVANDVKDGSVAPTALALLIGDLSYARGRQAFWDQHAYLNQPFASRIPLMTCLGNHEIGWNDTFFVGGDSGGECGVPTQLRFPMPSPPRKQTQQQRSGVARGFTDTPWYSFDHGSIHFLLMSTEHDWTIGSEQHAFLDADLGSVDRSRTPWVIMAGHRPMYVSSSDSKSPRSDMVVAALMRQHLESLLLKHKVDAFFAGHHHDAQRTCAVYNQTCVDRDRDGSQRANLDARLVDSDTDGSDFSADNGASPLAAPSFGTVHILTGAAGQWCNVLLDPSELEWLDFANTQVHGYSRVKARGNQLTVEFVASSDRKVWDSVTILKEQQGRAPVLRRNPSASYRSSEAQQPPLIADA